MKEIITLLKPRFWSLRNSGFKKSRGSVSATHRGKIKFIVLLVMGFFLWTGLFFVSLRMLTYFSKIEEMGEILAFKLLSVILVTLFSLLVFSSILVILSKLYLSRDLLLVHSMPVKSYKIFIARWIESFFDSSWMVILYILPILGAYGLIYNGGCFFYLSSLFSLVLLALTACALSSLIILTAVIVVPASRIRTIFVFMGLSLFIALYIGVRILKPERLVDPEMFSATLFYLKAMQTPSSPLLPTTWAHDAIMAALNGDSANACFHMALSFSFTCLMVFVMVLVSDVIYFKGMSKARSASARLFKKRRLYLPIFRYLPGPVKALATIFFQFPYLFFILFM